MGREYLVALGAGILSAMAFTPAAGGFVGAPLFAFFSAMPLMLTGLRRGSPHATMAVVAGFAASVVLSGLMGGGFYGILIGLPVLLVARQSLSSVRAPDGTVAWYPPGSVLCWLALFVAALLFLLAAGLRSQGTDMETVVKDALDQVFEQLLANIPDADPAAQAERAAFLFPGVAGMLWVFMIAANAAAAQAILTRVGRAIRPMERIRNLVLPDWYSWALVGAAAAALLAPPTMEYAARNLTVVVATPFMLLGVAVVHSVARMTPFRGLLLAAFYMVWLVTGWVVALPVTAAGLLEQWVGLRRRMKDPDEGEGEGNEGEAE